MTNQKDYIINIKFTNHFINRLKERCKFLDEKAEVYNFLSNTYMNGIICNKTRSSICYLGIPELNARIPLKKIGDKQYLTLTYMKGIVYLNNSRPCVINWIYEKDSCLDNEVEKLDAFNDENLDE